MTQVKFPARRSLTVLLCLCSLMLAGVARAATPQPLASTYWPMFQGGPKHQGRSPYPLPATEPEVLWRVQLPLNYIGETGTGLSMGIDGSVYATISGALFSVDPKTGDVIWARYHGSHSRSTPAVAADGSLYWGVNDAVAVLTTTGEMVGAWDGLTGNQAFGSSPVIAPDGTVYVSHQALWSLSPHTRSINWYYEFDSIATPWAPAIGDDGRIYMAGEGALFAFNPDGSVAWRRDIRAYGSPSIADDGTIYVATYGARIYAFSPDGTQRWVFTSDEGGDLIDSSISYGLAIGPDGSIHFGTHVSGFARTVSHIYAVKPDGTLKWKHPVPARPNSNPGAISPFVVDSEGRALGCADNGLCYAFAPDGTLLWDYLTHELSWNRAGPLITPDGVVLILDALGTLHALVPPGLPRLEASPPPPLFRVDHKSDPFTVTLQISSTLEPLAWSVTLPASESWITTSPLSGTTAALQTIGVDPALAPTGYSTATLKLAADRWDVLNRKISFPIRLFVWKQQTHLPLVEG